MSAPQSPSKAGGRAWRAGLTIGGSASGNYATVVASARRAEASGIDAETLRTTLLVAPQFPADSAGDIPEDRHRWTRTGWASGDNSVTRPAVSSYAVLDQLVAELTGPAASRTSSASPWPATPRAGSSHSATRRSARQRTVSRGT